MVRHFGASMVGFGQSHGCSHWSAVVADSDGGVPALRNLVRGRLGHDTSVCLGDGGRDGRQASLADVDVRRGVGSCLGNGRRRSGIARLASNRRFAVALATRFRRVCLGSVDSIAFDRLRGRNTIARSSVNRVAVLSGRGTACGISRVRAVGRCRRRADDAGR